MPRRSRSRHVSVLLVCLCFYAGVSAQTESVAGTWLVDPNRGDTPLMGKHPSTRPEDLIDGLLTIRLDSARATVDASTGSRVVSRIYELNSLDVTKPRATHLDRVLIVQRTDVVQLPVGHATVDIVERYTLQVDGSLLLERTATTGGRSTTRRHIFERKR